MFRSMTKKCVLVTLILSSIAFSLHAENNTGIYPIMSGENKLIIVDTNTKKILVYDLKNSKGMLLKEVRSFEDALGSKSFTSKGLTAKDEKKHLSSK